MKKIRINFVDFYRGFDKENNDITNTLRKKYEVELSQDPEYLFYSVFGHEFLKHDCVRIFYTGECVVPDFNLCDYAIGFDHIQFGDRYIRVPLYKLFQYREKYEMLLRNERKCAEKNAFCSFVCSNDQGMPERDQMFRLLSEYKTVDSGGRYLNNVGGPVDDKMKFDSIHKFSIAFENCSHIGYTTEKIVEAFAAGTIPIYYGNPNIGDEFNTKSFINCHEFSSLEDVVDYVKVVDSDDALFHRMLNEKIVLEDSSTMQELENFLYRICDVPLEQAKKRPCNTRIDEKECQLVIYTRYDKFFGRYIKKIKALVRRLKKRAI